MPLAKETSLRPCPAAWWRRKSRRHRTDPKKNKLSIVLLADDKHDDKKDKTVIERVQFLLSKTVQSYELVVNDVKKDLITEYFSRPKASKPLLAGCDAESFR